MLTLPTQKKKWHAIVHGSSGLIRQKRHNHTKSLRRMQPESETGKAFRRARSRAGRLRMLSISPCRTSMPMILNALSKPDSDPDSLLFGIGVVLCCISVGVLVKDIALSSWRTLLCLPGGHCFVFVEDIAMSSWRTSPCLPGGHRSHPIFRFLARPWAISAYNRSTMFDHNSRVWPKRRRDIVGEVDFALDFLFCHACSFHRALYHPSTEGKRFPCLGEVLQKPLTLPGGIGVAYSGV